jgi:hypothetical protein
MVGKFFCDVAHLLLLVTRWDETKQGEAKKAIDVASIVSRWITMYP